MNILWQILTNRFQVKLKKMMKYKLINRVNPIHVLKDFLVIMKVEINLVISKLTIL
jgi:hypothetical protein